MPIILTPTSSDIDDIIYPVVRHVITTPRVVTPIGFTPVVTTPVITTPILSGPVIPVSPFVKYTVDVDTGLNDNYIAQEQMTRFLLNERIIKHWIKEPEFKKILKFMKVHDNKVTIVKNEKEYEENNSEYDSKEDKKLKGQYIRDNILGMKEMRKLLIKIINEIGFKWKHLCLPREENIVMKVARKFIRRHFQNAIGIRNKK